MTVEVKLAISDAIASGTEILQICGGDAGVCGESRLESLAIERLFLNLGESMARVKQQAPELMDQITASREIIGFRNVLAHGYDQIDPERVRSVIRRWLPMLIQDLRTILGDDPSDHEV